ncbi:MAG: hypothetical protein Q4F27_05440, partial [Desulfovibrionaceae bacterium]|nr:hypothetical protein [Desulfovibrionaceae bacterium]
MTIRGIIKTSHLVQLALLLILAVSFVWLAWELKQVNAVLTELPGTEALADRVEKNSREKFGYAQDYVYTGPDYREPLQKLQELWQLEKGEKVRPEGCPLAPGKKVSQKAIAASLPVCDKAQLLLQNILKKNDQLNRELERAVMMAGGFGKTEDGIFVKQVMPKLGVAEALLDSASLKAALEEIQRLHRELQHHLVHELVARLGKSQASLMVYLALAGGGVLLLLGSLLGSVRILHKRLTRPLALVGDYAEAVANGHEPSPLNMKYGDELSSMYGSMLKMQHTLSLRIREIKASERSAQASSQQAMLVKAQALASLNIA